MYRYRFWALGAVGLLIIGVVLWIVFGQASQGVPQVVLTGKQNVSYSLFYPQPMPAGYRLVDDSFKQTGSVTMFNVSDSKGRTVIITEQAKPSTMEELKQTKQFTTPAGKAYIADLNGRLAGVIVAGSTLIIASPANDAADADQLQALLSSFSRL